MELRSRTFDLSTQREALTELAKLVARSIVEDPNVRITALKITRACSSRDDECEIQAIFDAIKHGTPEVESLKKGLRYVSDPRLSDYFVKPGRLLEMCEAEACGEDCDGHAGLIAALLGSLGYAVGLRAYAKPENPGEFVHVYAVVGFPKNGRDESDWLGLDTTVESSYVGWEPPEGRVLTAYIR